MGLDIYFRKAKQTNYYRKYNFLYGFFSKDREDESRWSEDSQTAKVYKEGIGELLRRLNEVSNDHSKAEELLPVYEGFFFGSYEYDDHYFSCIEHCKEEMQELYNNMSDDEIIYVYFSW